MKLIPFLLAYLFSALLVTAQTTSSPGGQQNSTNQQQGQNEEDEKDKENPHKYNKEGDWILNLIKSGTINDMSFPQDNKDWKL